MSLNVYLVGVFFPPPVVTKLQERGKIFQEEIEYKFHFIPMFYAGIWTER